MSSPEFGNGSPRARSGTRYGARNLSRAVAERERGRRRLNATTATVGFASVLAVGAVAVALPGSTHKTTSSSSSSSPSTSSNNSGSLQAPANTPVQSGGGQITSGGT